MDNNLQNQSNQIPPEMRTYILSLLADAGITDIDEGLREDMVNEIFVRLDKYIISVIIDNMDTADVETFIQMNEDKKSQEEVQKFILEKIPNAQEVMTKAFVDFRQLYLGKVTVASNIPEELPAQKDIQKLN